MAKMSATGVSLIALWGGASTFGAATSIVLGLPGQIPRLPWYIRW
jgi:hypothetical protein